MKKVLYVITSLAHKRVFESFEERQDMEQMIIGPRFNITSGIVPEDYRDFKIKNIGLFDHTSEIQKYVNDFKPDVFVQASQPCAAGIKLPGGCKKVYVGHGAIPRYMIDIAKSKEIRKDVWRGCDLYCCMLDQCADYIKYAAGVDDSKILTGSIPQIDILYDSNYYNLYKQKVLNKTRNPDAKKVILFIGFCCKDRSDFGTSNEDYFKSVIEMEKIARKHNWLVMVKPRQTFKTMIKFLKTHGWGKKYIKQYTEVQNSKYLHFITTTGHIYRYFFADAIVMNGTSTVEIEACAIKKPLFIIRTDKSYRYDGFDVLKTKTAKEINNTCDVESCLVSHFKTGAFHWPEKQEEFIKNIGVKLDGKIHKRIQDKLLNIN